MKYVEYTAFDIGSQNEQDLFAPRTEAEPTLFDRHVSMESIDRGFDYRTWQMLFKPGLVIGGVLLFGWFCASDSHQSDNNEAGIVTILKSDHAP